MATSYPGIGRQLYLSTYSGVAPGTSQVTFPLNAEIVNTAFSDSEATNDAQSLSIVIDYDTNPAAVTTIEFSSEPTFTNPMILDTIPAMPLDLTAVWSTQGNYLLPGFIRINNTSGQTITNVRVQKLVNSM